MASRARHLDGSRAHRRCVTTWQAWDNTAAAHLAVLETGLLWQGRHIMPLGAASHIFCLLLPPGLANPNLGLLRSSSEVQRLAPTKQVTF